MKQYWSEWTDLVLPWLLSHGVKILLIIIGAYLINMILYKFIIKAVRLTVVHDGTSSLEAEKKREDTLIRIFYASLKIAILTVVGLTVLQELGVMIGPILAGAGIVGLAFGFGGQYLIRDIISGLFIILENQYRIGDVVCFDQTCGLVEDISLRMSTLRDMDGTVHHIPHGEIKKVSNLTKNFSRVNLNIGVAYGSQIDQVIEVVNRTGIQLATDPEWKESILTPPKFLRVDDFGDSAIIIKITGDTLPIKQWDVTGEFRKRIIVAFNQEGIEIPFPQRVIHQVNSSVEEGGYK